MTADLKWGFAISGTRLLSGSFVLAGSGTAARVGGRKPVHVAMLRLAGRYDRANARITLDDATLDSNLLHAHVVGGMNLIYDTSGGVSRLGVDLTADKTAIEVPGTFAQPLFVPLAQLTGSYIPT